MSKEKLKTVNIKGKEYVTVNERIRYFNEAYKGGCIKTELLNIEDKTVLMKAIVWPDSTQQERFFTGYAQETQGRGLVNSTSYIENCETSAVGRALGFLGIGVETSIASADEVAKAIASQNEPGPLKEPQPKEPDVEDTEKITEMVNKAEEIVGDSPPEPQDEPEEPEEPKAKVTSPKQGKAEKKPNKQEILTLIDKLGKKNPKEVTAKDLRPAFEGIKQILSEEERLDVLNSFGITSRKDIKSSGVAMQILGIMAGRVKREKE